MAHGGLQHTPVSAQGKKREGEGRWGDFPPLWVALHLAELLALQPYSVQNHSSFTQKQASALHLSNFLMRVTSSSDLNPAGKIT